MAFSASTWAYPGEQTSNFKPILIISSASAVLGKLVMAIGAEDHLARLAPPFRGTGPASAGHFWLLAGAAPARPRRPGARWAGGVPPRPAGRGAPTPAPRGANASLAGWRGGSSPR